MDSKFTHGIDSLKRINGNSPGDEPIARKAVQEMKQFIHSHASILDNYLDLKRILTADSAEELKSAESKAEELISMAGCYQVTAPDATGVAPGC